MICEIKIKLIFKFVNKRHHIFYCITILMFYTLVMQIDVPGKFQIISHYFIKLNKIYAEPA